MQISQFLDEHRLVFGPPPERTVYGDSGADILSRGRGFIGGFDFTLQTQVGCPAGCLFCYVRRGERLAPADVRRDWGYRVRRKLSVARKWRKHLDSRELSDRTVYWSGVTDPYSDSPSVTRGIWNGLLATPVQFRPRRLAVQSRFRVDRDAALIAAYIAGTRTSDDGPPVVVSLSISTDRDDLVAGWERATPKFESRMTTAARLCAAGICVVVTLSPFTVWNDLPSALDRMRDMGVSYLTVLFYKDDCAASLTPPRFLDRLTQVCPEVLDPDWQQEQLRRVKLHFGTEHVVPGRDGFASLTAPHRVLQSVGRP